ncbi:MAG: GTPase HflX [Roseomonas mucosa]|uniref:GTPase HflX n=1 Tax=Roseomonas mucosa TaxID=207340 RepID=A0A1S8D767_9PROT|nr:MULTISPECIES: GTPase HflX [Roseomonas]MBS5901179.1 GTPase HflX [Acetobacteraceae bacterium]MCG7350971.1 GTPase HflX [Roseomonas mucosa]MCG7355505.1 GTPase HflX [Roseomonas mucosa]MDT8288212.1 GTPase HflX [Roseomonas mucosa]MDT8293901.1 GTPase HflX [Roseomonas mucosa]
MSAVLTDTRGGPTPAAVILPWEKPARTGPDFPGASRAAEARLAEAVGLAASIGVAIVHSAALPLRTRRPSTLLGEGQVESVALAVKEHHVQVVVVDAALTPVQQRNLERAWGCKVIDRTGLILEIFGERARTREGSLQVELAHLEYQRTRLVRSWTHLERQRGGFGFLGGPGESQIEIDRRLIGERIVKLKKELEQVRRTRGLHRRAREKVPHPVVALVGYTNAGKSTLFNALTGASVYAQDQLFATLDPTMRAIRLPSGRTVILSDTVGFISELPTQLVEAFRATLEEVAAADVILHVRDVAHPDSAAQRADVLEVLNEMAEGPDAALDPEWTNRMLEVLNKADLLGGLDQAAERGAGEAIAVSALTGEGLDRLRLALDERLSAGMVVTDVAVEPADGATVAWLYQNGEVLAREDGEDAIHLRVRLSQADLGRFETRQEP